MNILVARREVTINAGRIDLFGIDSDGTLYIFELKVNTARSAIIGQVIAYRQVIRTMSRDQLTESVRQGPGGVDLATEFERHFGHRMPEIGEHEPVMVLIAGAFDLNTSLCVTELAEKGFGIVALLYVISDDRVALVRALRPDGTVSLSPPGRRSLWQVVPVRPDVREFCGTRLDAVVPPVMTFQGIYAMYTRWVIEQEGLGRGMQFLQPCAFGRELAAFMANSGQWVRGFALPGTRIDPCEPLEAVPSLRPRKTEGHRVVAYRRVA
ncbi:hypothetical protein FHX49_000670 [Microbacterium endophyticum]|uniref:DUF91 domain-containing protein n=1 Tax=Microbacterium endophyticum TaxID=1526412 RepID=A0A7W4YM38_9MICO|nr:hypothetical protein [Microbacterium endophyticum]MBB2975129.1 hypothetical protein [Microbacterium endophyticum]NIK37331.1 hypothetical protein [Microbacterium endophyticum]